MKARQALIDQWQLMEKHGIKPSARKCIALVRLMGIKVRNEEGFACLEKFRGALWERSKSDTGSSKGSEKQAQREHFEVLPKENAGSVPSAPSRVNKELLVTKITSNPQSANALSPPKGAERVRPEVDPVEFDDEDERRVKQLIVFVAAENQTGTVSAGRILTLRAEMFAEFGKLGPERWRYGVDEANSRGKPWSYARSVMRRHADVPHVGGPVRAGPGVRRPGYSDSPPPPDKMAIYATLGRKKDEHAVRE